MKLPGRLRHRFSGMGRIATEHRLRRSNAHKNQRAQSDEEAKDHGVLRSASGASIGPWLTVPLISPDCFEKRPSNVIPNSSDLTVTKSPSCVTRLTGTLFTFLPTIVNSTPAASAPRFENFIVACLAYPIIS